MTSQTYRGRALITGASTGIGAVYADRFARRGYDLILIARDARKLDSTAQRITRETGRKVEALVADLTQRDALARIEDRLRTDSSITALVNNAGLGAAAPLLDSDIDALDTMIQINVTALTRLVRAAAPGFVARGEGVIVNIASIVAVAPELLNGVYSGTKAFVVNFTQSLHNEVASKGVQVQAVLPGAIRTEFWDRAGLPVENVPAEGLMSAEELVDAALAGLDQKELITIPSLPNVDDWNSYEAARRALGPNLSRQHPAERYRIVK
jgi:short-subunit dehydrogenase